MTPRVALLVVGDGRDHLRADTVASFHENARDLDLVTTIEVDDREHRFGFCGAIREGWARLRAVREATMYDFVFHLEEDWRFDRAFSLRQMADVLDADRSLCQVALRRGPENDVERAAGGLVEVWPREYVDCLVHEPSSEPIPFLRHALFFTTNPSLYHGDLVDAYEWPPPPRCEEEFGLTMRAEGLRFAFLGARSDEPWVTHTGRLQRRGTGY